MQKDEVIVLVHDLIENYERLVEHQKAEINWLYQTNAEQQEVERELREQLSVQKARYNFAVYTLSRAYAYIIELEEIPNWIRKFFTIPERQELDNEIRNIIEQGR